MTDTARSFTEEAYEDLQRTRDEILKRYPDASYLRERYGVIDVMQMDFPEDEEGEKVYKSIIARAASLKFI